MGSVRRLGKNTLLVFIGKIGSGLISFIMLPLYTRWLTVEEFALSDIISVYSSFLVIFVTFCIGESLFVFPKGQEKEVQTKYFSSALTFVISMMLLAASILFALGVCVKVFNWSNSFFDNIWSIYILLVCSTLQQLTQQFTRSIDRMKVFSSTGVVNTALIAVTAFLFMPKFGLKGYVWSLALSNFLSAAYSFIASGSYAFINLHTVRKVALLAMLKYSVPLMPNGVMWWLVSSLNRPLMETYLGLHDIGIYSVANKFPALLNMVFTIFSTSWQISVLEEFKKNTYSDFYNKIFKVVFVALMIVLLTITLSSKLLVTIFADNDYYIAWKYIPILTLGTLFSCLSSFVGVNFSATRESKYYFYSSIWGAVISVAFNFILIPIWGLWGVCVSLVLSFVAMFLSRYIYSAKMVKITSIGYYSLICLFVLLTIVAYTINVHLLITITVSIASIAMLYLFSKNEIKMCFNMVIKK